MEHTGAQAIQYFVSEYISPEANLYVLLVVTIVAVPLFTVADAHYGSGTSRNICGKKRPASVDIGSDWSDAAPARSVKEKGTCRKDIICIEVHSIYVYHVPMYIIYMPTICTTFNNFASQYYGISVYSYMYFVYCMTADGAWSMCG